MGKKKLLWSFTVLFFTGVIILFLWLIPGYIKARQPVTHLPEIPGKDTIWYTKSSKEAAIIIKSPYYTLEANTSGRLAVKSPVDELIISDLIYFSSYVGQNDNWGLHNVSVNQENDSTLSVYGTGLSGTLVNVLFIAHTAMPKLDIRITSKYNTEVTVNREAFVAVFDVPISEVYKKNRQVDTENFQSEYWLQNQGVRFGSGSRSSLLYHAPGISSLQLNSTKRLLFINLDYYEDHPFINIPFQADGSRRWVDLSPSRYNAKYERTDSVTLYFGNIPEFLPRMMLVPSGYIAGHVFTEHADGGGSIEPHYAAYFGSDSITNVNNASGGFAGHSIPVTKSVMFSDSMGNLADSTTGEATAWRRMTVFLDQLHETGLYDICLHTPEDLNSNRQALKEAISYMKGRYDTRSWIDHGMYAGNINRECFVCDGLNTESEYYAADLWKEFDTRYFWSSAVELIRNKDRTSASDQLRKLKLLSASEALWENYLSPDQLQRMNPGKALGELVRLVISKEEELNSFFPDKGESYPTPLYWQHPAYTEGFYSWVTDYVKDYRRLASADAVRQLEREKKVIDLLISNWGIFIGHGYYVRDHDILSEQNGHLYINPYFDQLLDYLEVNQNKGDLYNTTVRDLLDYWTLTENVSFSYNPDGTIYLYNNNDLPINGFSLAVRAHSVLIDGVVPASRRYKEDLIFWFDVPAKSRVTIKCD
jgi:hypothetical protein